MTILRIEHKVQSYEAWKKVFDNDPINRMQSGVRRHRIFRPFENPDYVIIDLEFDELNNAKTTLKSLQKLWSDVEGKAIFNPLAQILNVEEAIEY